VLSTSQTEWAFDTERPGNNHNNPLDLRAGIVLVVLITVMVVVALCEKPLDIIPCTDPVNPFHVWG